MAENIPTEEEIRDILFWVMLNSPTPQVVRDAFGEVFELDHWNIATGRRNLRGPCLIWQHEAERIGGETRLEASERATWYVTESGLMWLKAYEERQNDTK